MVVSQEVLSRAEEIADQVSYFTARSRRFSRRRVTRDPVKSWKREKKTARIKSLVPRERASRAPVNVIAQYIPIFLRVSAISRGLAIITCHSHKTRGAIKRSRFAFYHCSLKLQVMNSTGVFGNFEQR